MGDVKQHGVWLSRYQIGRRCVEVEKFLRKFSNWVAGITAANEVVLANRPPASVARLLHDCYTTATRLLHYCSLHTGGSNDFDLLSSYLISFDLT